MFIWFPKIFWVKYLEWNFCLETFFNTHDQLVRKSQFIFILCCWVTLSVFFLFIFFLQAVFFAFHIRSFDRDLIEWKNHARLLRNSSVLWFGFSRWAGRPNTYVRWRNAFVRVGSAKVFADCSPTFRIFFLEILFQFWQELLFGPNVRWMKKLLRLPE